MRMFAVSLLGAATLLGVAVADAQTAAPQALTRTQSFNRSGGGVVDPGPRPLFTVGRFNGVIDAPVAGPDNGVAYQTYAGQPMTGADAILLGGRAIPDGSPRP